MHFDLKAQMTEMITDAHKFVVAEDNFITSGEDTPNLAGHTNIKSNQLHAVLYMTSGSRHLTVELLVMIATNFARVPTVD